MNDNSAVLEASNALALTTSHAAIKQETALDAKYEAFAKNATEKLELVAQSAKEKAASEDLVKKVAGLAKEMEK